MSASVALSSMLDHEARAHLLRADRQEDLCFALWYPSQGRDRFSALVQRLILPNFGERSLHGNVSFLPQYFERAVGLAMDANAGLALLHSHPAAGWQGMSQDDIVAEERNAPAVMGATGLPFVGLTLGTDGSWSARMWQKTAPRTYTREWCESVRVVGERLAVTFNDALIPTPAFRPELSRTVSAWGPRTQAQLARLHVGVVGAGSVGSLVAEALARMGVRHLRLIDFDDLELHNLDRQLHATYHDVTQRRAKVEILAEGLRRGATADGFVVEPLDWSIAEETGYRAMLDCDVLFSCVDRPWPRSILNFIAYAHLIPVIDGGLYIRAKRDGAGLRHADWRAHVAAPTRRCLECLNQYDPGLVAADREGYLDDPSYITGLPEDHPFRHNENVFGFSMSAASFEVLQFLSLVIAPQGLSNHGAQRYRFVTSTLERDDALCKPGCLYPDLIARGDRSGMTVTGVHSQAERKRLARRKRSRQISIRGWLNTARAGWRSGPWWGQSVRMRSKR